MSTLIQLDSEQSSEIDSLIVFDDAKKIKKLITKDGFDVNADIYGYSLLMQAVANDAHDTVKMLIEHGANIHALDEAGNSVMHIAALESMDNEGRMIDILVAAGGQVEAVNHQQMTPLHFAVTNGYVGILKSLIRHGANVNAVDAGGNTPLMHLACKRELNLTLHMNLLLDAGASSDIVNDQWQSFHDLAEDHALSDYADYISVHPKTQCAAADDAQSETPRRRPITF